MRAANSLPHGKAATPSKSTQQTFRACDNTPRTARMQEVARSPVAAPPPRCCRGGRSDGRRPPCAT
eukprot:scaffold52979_cov121-Phaeocystis_antarctica.AAC.1